MQCTRPFVIFADGERYRILRILIGPDGLPHWYATLFVTTQFRNLSNAPNTLFAVLGCIRLLRLPAAPRMRCISISSHYRWLPNPLQRPI